MKWYDPEKVAKKTGAIKVKITIKNWSKYQSYKDRKPPWIRFHRSILDDYKFQSMSAEARAMLPMIWLLACENEDPKAGIIELEIREIAFRLRQSIENIEHCLFELQVSDFITCIESVTNPLQERNENVTTETETETDIYVDENADLSENKFSDDDLDFARFMFTTLKQISPKLKEPNFNIWADVIRLLRERDNRNHSEIKDVFLWAVNDDFWQANILSPKSLRKNFVRLEIQKNKSLNTNSFNNNDNWI